MINSGILVVLYKRDYNYNMGKKLLFECNCVHIYLVFGLSMSFVK